MIFIEKEYKIVGAQSSKSSLTQFGSISSRNDNKTDAIEFHENDFDAKVEITLHYYSVIVAQDGGNCSGQNELNTNYESHHIIQLSWTFSREDDGKICGQGKRNTEILNFDGFDEKLLSDDSTLALDFERIQKFKLLVTKHVLCSCI